MKMTNDRQAKATFNLKLIDYLGCLHLLAKTNIFVEFYLKCFENIQPSKGSEETFTIQTSVNACQIGTTYQYNVLR